MICLKEQQVSFKRYINRMFEISNNYNLDICGPSFEATKSIISRPITKHKTSTLLTYTNFVEVNVPLFNKKSMHNLMRKIDYTLIGWVYTFYIYMQLFTV